MRMTPLGFILFRFYLLTVGKMSIGSRLLKRFLVWRLISVEKEKYVASSRYFTLNELR